MAGIWITVEAVERLLRGGNVQQSVWGMTILVASCITNCLVSCYLFRSARETQSVALEADAWHLCADVWTSLGVAGSLLVAFVADAKIPHWNVAWLDPTAAIAVALLIPKVAWGLTQSAMLDLLDAFLPESEQAMIQVALRRHPEVLGAHGVRARRCGPTRFIELHLVVHPQTPVVKAPELEHVVANRLRELWGNTRLLAHVEPCDHRCPNHCRGGCWIPEQQRAVTKGDGQNRAR